MPEYINREALIDRLRPYYFKHNKLEESDDIILAKDDTLATVISEIREMPADNVVDIKTLTPCDVCAYNPPSSFGQKPCFMCTAQARDWGESRKGKCQN